ncbi:hypothetical protein [uncultured Erythrobacter sp.]|uniref:hypothetical protein n=1 Tax=uncultured Erythrobacter sp. TaxID=263913 RepID=UPI0026072D77|nr:hypothetical protein [uncultured Erythrobacter sp.]
MAAQIEPKEMSLEEQLAAIRRDMAELDNRRSEETGEPWKFYAWGLISGATLVAASVIFTKLFLL